MPLILIKRHGLKNWYLRGNIAGHNFFQSTGVSDLKAAENIRIRTEAEILERVTLGKKASHTFAQAALTYIQSGGEARFLEPILKHFGPSTKISEIDNATVNAAAAALYPNAKPATINRQLITPICAIIRLAAEDGFCDLRTFRRRKVAGKKTRWLTPEEFELFAANLADHLSPIIGFMIGTGARARETLSLELSTFYPNVRQALLVHTKNGHPRMVRYPERAGEMIGKRQPGTGRDFLTNLGKPFSNKTRTGGQIKTGFNAARDAAGLGPDVTPHTMRHTWATWYYSQTRDFGSLLDLGGWSSADVANIYRKISPDDLSDRLLAHGWDYRPDTARTANETTAQKPEHST